MNYVKEVGSYGVQTVGYLYSKLGSPRTQSEKQTETEPECESEKINEPEKQGEC